MNQWRALVLEGEREREREKKDKQQTNRKHIQLRGEPSAEMDGMHVGCAHGHESRFGQVSYSDVGNEWGKAIDASGKRSREGIL
jgi:hypothetical protein